MSELTEQSLLIQVDDPRRAPLGLGIRATLLAAFLFVGYVVSVKDIKTLSDVAPWTEDPYDAFFSFAIFFVAFVSAVSSVRMLLCHRFEALPAGRVVGLIRGGWVIVACLLVTLGAGWVSLAASTASTAPALTLPIAGLVVATAAAIVATFLLWTSARPFRTAGSVSPDSPDWLTDALSLGASVSRRLGPAEDVAVRSMSAIDRRMAPAIRRHRLTAAFVTALAVGAFVGLGAAIEQDPAVLVVLLTAIGTAAMFAFLVTVGSYLGLVRSRSAGSRRPRAILHAAVAAATSLPIVVAFRDSLWWLIGSDADTARLDQLAELLGVIAVATFVVVFLSEVIVHRRSARN